MEKKAFQKELVFQPLAPELHQEEQVIFPSLPGGFQALWSCP